MTTINWSNISGVGDFLQTANTSSSGSFWVTMLYTFVLIVFLSLINFGAETASLAALFLGIVVGILLLNLGLIGITSLGILVGILLFLIIYFIYSGNRQQ